MQETRQCILAILKERGEATVDDIVQDLSAMRGSITAVTVRHHLAKLQKDGYVDNPQTRHRSAPGRPRHVFTLTQQGSARLPNNYQQLAATLVQQVQTHLPAQQVNVIFEGISTQIASDAQIPDGSLEERLCSVVSYLDEHGYDASWETHPEGYVLHTHNCPYHQVAQADRLLCQMDMQIIAKMLGVVPRLLARISEGGESCAYLIPKS